MPPGRRRWRRWLALGLVALFLLGTAPLLLFDTLGGNSQCRGKTGGGAVSAAVRLPFYGENYTSYCWLCVFALRTFGHHKVVDSVIEAYAALAESHPDTEFVYGEIGFPWGGRFPPHRTHQNGLSVDFMVPLVEGRLPTRLGNRFGYDEAFDAQGLGDSGQIDFDATAAHLLALQAAAERHGGRIARVFLAPDLQGKLRQTHRGQDLFDQVRFNQRPSWVRHDDHYHVDFHFPCEDQ